MKSRRVEKHAICRTSHYFSDLCDMTHKSKNLYNSALYAIRQHFFQTKKYLSYATVAGEFARSNSDFKSLPRKVSQQTLKLADQSFKSFFGLLKTTKKSEARLPSYLEKSGKYVTIFTKQALSFTKPGFVKLSGYGVFIKTDKQDIQQIRVVPKTNYFDVEVIYCVDEPETKTDNCRYLSVDIGLNNLATTASNVIKPMLINGKPLKAINQYYNKRKAELQSRLGDKTKTSNRISAITRKRNDKIRDYLHKASTWLINQLDSNSINTLIIGENKGWKQEINLGKKNNQNFVSVPFNKFKQLLTYKAKSRGINVICQEESYTSKASCLSNDHIPVYGSEPNVMNFSGYRKSRGIYRDKCLGLEINADVNGAYNILRKAVGDFTVDPIEACSWPVSVKISLDTNPKLCHYWH